MTNVKLGRWLLVAIAIVGLAFAAPVVSAHGSDATAADAPADDASADERVTWMEAQMTEHVGPGSVEWMESHMGLTVDEMARDVADEEHHNGADGEYHGGMYGQGHC